MPEMIVLDRSASLELLATVDVGRVAWVDASGRVIVQPVNFVVDDESVVFRTDEGDKLDAIREGRPMSFEADDLEPALRSGWSVLVSGVPEVVTGDDEQLNSLGVSPWDASPKRFFVRINAEQVSGRRLPLRAGGVTFGESDYK